tara:strand:- start:537 stop:977 length:441 start_codon:yes stop_codon:yes gene_type:complete
MTIFSKTTGSIKNTTTTLIAVPDLSFSLVTGSLYAFNFNVIYQGDFQTQGMRLGLSVPAFKTFQAKTYIPSTISSETVKQLTSSLDYLQSPQVPVINRKYLATIEGVIELSGSNGTLQVVFASELATGSFGITVNNNSVGILETVI